MSDYILPHSDPLEDDRLIVMSKMLDPHMHFRLSRLGPPEGWKCLEVGAADQRRGGSAAPLRYVKVRATLAKKPEEDF
jgi:hypothetical protein